MIHSPRIATSGGLGIAMRNSQPTSPMILQVPSDRTGRLKGGIDRRTPEERSAEPGPLPEGRGKLAVEFGEDDPNAARLVRQLIASF